MSVKDIISSGIQGAVGNVSGNSNLTYNVNVRLFPEFNGIIAFSLGVFIGISGLYTYSYITSNITSKKNVIPSAPPHTDGTVPEYPTNGTITQTTTSYNAPEYYNTK